MLTTLSMNPAMASAIMTQRTWTCTQLLTDCREWKEDYQRSEREEEGGDDDDNDDHQEYIVKRLTTGMMRRTPRVLLTLEKEILRTRSTYQPA